MKRKALILVACALLLSLVLVPGTLALLFHQAEQVNTFSVGKVDVSLTETPPESDTDPDPYTNIYEMLEPGETLVKDPVVTVKAGSEDCWLLVKLEESANFDTFLTYALVEGWVALEGHPGVYYYYVPVTNVTADRSFQILEGNVVTVKTSVTEEMLWSLDPEDAPTLEVTAYVVQTAGVDTPLAAWQIVEGMAAP